MMSRSEGGLDVKGQLVFLITAHVGVTHEIQVVGMFARLRCHKIKLHLDNNTFILVVVLVLVTELLLILLV